MFYGVGKKTKISLGEVYHYIRIIHTGGTIASIYNLQGLIEIIPKLNRLSAYSLATHSFFDNKNTFGTFLGITVVCGFYLFSIDRKKIYLVSSLFQLAMCIFSFCRSALLFLLVYFILQYKNFKKIAFIILLASIICLILHSSTNISQFIIEKVLRLEYTDTGRRVIWHNVWISSNFHGFDYLIGIGPSEMEWSSVSYVHNIYLESLVTGGFAKIFYYAFLLSYSLYNITKIQDMNLRVFCSGVMGGYLVYGMVESVLLFELGLIPFLFAFITFFIPCLQSNQKDLWD